MTKLELVIKNDIALMSSRTIAEAFEKEVKSVNRAIRERFGDGAENFHEQLQEVRDYRGYVTDYLLDEYQAYKLTMGFTGDKARAIQDMVVKTFVDYKNGLLPPRHSLPADYPSALRALADAEEQKLALVKSTEIANKRGFSAMGTAGAAVRKLNLVLATTPLTLEQRNELLALIGKKAKELGDVKENGRICRHLKQHFNISLNNGKWYHVPRKDFEEAKTTINNYKK